MTAAGSCGNIGLKDVVARGDLRRRTDSGTIRKYTASAFDRELLDVADAAVRKRVPIALVLPVPGTHAGVLLASTILIDDFVRTRRLEAEVALVTRQLALRAFYDRLYCGAERLADYFPRTIVSMQGVLSEVGSRPAGLMVYPGRLHFMSRLHSVLGHKEPLAGVVVESNPAEEEDIPRLVATLVGKLPVIYLTTDPMDPVLSVFQETGAVWAWDLSSLAELSKGGDGASAIVPLQRALKNGPVLSFEIVEPATATEIDAAVAILWDDLSEMQHHPGGPTFEAIQWVWGVTGSLSQLVVPVDDYDRHARATWGTTPLDDAPRKAEAYARNAVRPEDREYWDLLALDLADAVSAARRSNAKPEGLVQWVRTRVLEKRAAVVAVRNRAALKAATEYLQIRPDVPIGWTDTVKIVTLADLNSGRVDVRSDGLLFSGPVSSRYAGLLVTPTGGNHAALVHGPWEGARTARQVTAVAQRLTDLATGSTRREAIIKLFGRVEEAVLDRREVPVRISMSHPDLRPPRLPRAAREALWDPFDIKVVRSLGRRDMDTDAPSKDSAPGQDANVPAIVISFDEGLGLFEPDCLVSRLDNGELREVAAKALHAGDRIILVDKAARRDLFDVIVDRLEELPEFTAVTMLVREWHERARQAGFFGGMSYAKILRGMPGTSISSPVTIGMWARGVVHGPQDPKDIERFGISVGDEVLTTRWQAIGTALDTMRYHRRKIGRMLASALTGASLADVEDDGYFDRRLGIHFSDLTEAVTDHTVRAVSANLVLVPYQYANRLLEPTEAGEIMSIIGGER